MSARVVNDYARGIALHTGRLRVSDIIAGDAIYCRTPSGGYSYAPSVIARASCPTGSRIVTLVHESGDITEHDHKTMARLAD